MGEHEIELVWAGDLLGRREEAETVLAYLTAVSSREVPRGEPRAFTFAVDAGYGFGKTFFLRRFAKTAALQHPVAFIDAWSDDLADEPFTALAATLKNALSPLLEKPAMRDRWKEFRSKSGKVAKIVAGGVLKKALGLVITEGGAHALENALSADLSEAVSKALEEGVGDIVDEAGEALSLASDAFMEQRIAAFETAQSSIRDMKASLAAIIETLKDSELSAPIIIVIDELDRCRPTYAVKLLEEIKHLFDVPGLIFVFGMHGDQLARSICGAYGPDFDGAAYLKRFVSRRYELKEPDLRPLVKFLLSNSSVVLPRLSFPHMNTAGFSLDAVEVIAATAITYGLSARDLFEYVDYVETSAALVGEQHLVLPYLLPLIAGRVKGVPAGQAPPVSSSPGWDYRLRTGGGYVDLTIDELFREIASSAKLPRDQLVKVYNAVESPGYPLEVVASSRFGSGVEPRYTVANYDGLINTVSRFSRASPAE